MLLFLSRGSVVVVSVLSLARLVVCLVQTYVLALDFSHEILNLGLAQSCCFILLACGGVVVL